VKTIADQLRSLDAAEAFCDVTIKDTKSEDDIPLLQYVLRLQTESVAELAKASSMEHLLIVSEISRIITNLAVHVPDALIEEGVRWDGPIDVASQLESVFFNSETTWSSEYREHFLTLVQRLAMYISNLFLNLVSRGFLPTPSPTPFAVVAPGAFALARIVVAATRQVWHTNGQALFVDTLTALERIFDACDDAFILVFTEAQVTPSREQLEKMLIDSSLMLRTCKELSRTLHYLSSHENFSIHSKRAVANAAAQVIRTIVGLGSTAQKCAQLIESQSPTQRTVLDMSKTLLFASVDVAFGVASLIATYQGHSDFMAGIRSVLGNTFEFKEIGDRKEDSERTSALSLEHDFQFDLAQVEDVDSDIKAGHPEREEGEDEDEKGEPDEYGLGGNLRIWLDFPETHEYVTNPPPPTTLVLVAQSLTQAVTLLATPVLLPYVAQSSSLVAERIPELALSLTYIALSQVSLAPSIADLGRSTDRPFHSICCNFETIRTALSALVVSLRASLSVRARGTAISRLTPNLLRHLMDISASTHERVPRVNVVPPNDRWVNALKILDAEMTASIQEGVSAAVSLLLTLAVEREDSFLSARQLALDGIRKAGNVLKTITHWPETSQPHLTQAMLRTLAACLGTAASTAPDLGKPELRAQRAEWAKNLLDATDALVPIKLLTELLTLSWRLTNTPDSSNPNPFESMYEAVTTCIPSEAAMGLSFEYLQPLTDSTELRGLISAQGPLPMIQMCTLALLDRVLLNGDNTNEPDDEGKSTPSGISQLVDFLLAHPCVFANLLTSLFAIASPSCPVIQMRMASRAVASKLVRELEDRAPRNEVARNVLQIHVQKDPSKTEKVSLKAYFE